MSVITSDIVYVLSGGVSNSDPNNSLGGDPSSTPILSETLFANISEAETKAGKIDYRCFYVFNNNDSDTLYNIRAFLVEVPGGATAQIGLNLQQETQEISITGTFSGGSFDLQVTPSQVDASPVTVTVNVDADATIFAQNIQDAINITAGINSVTVSVGSLVQSLGIYSQVVFEVQYGDDETFRYQELLSISTNALTGGSPIISVNKVISGSPLNIIADEVDFETTSPNNIPFVDTDSDNYIELGNLLPLDGFPVWVKRQVIAGTEALGGDGFIFRLQGHPVQID